MFKSKIIALAGATVVAVSVLAGVTYAWFTSTDSDSIAQITAGNLGIEINLTSTSSVLPLYPQETTTDEDGYPIPVINGTEADVVTNTFTLQNASDRKVLVKVSGAKLLIDEKPVELDDDDAVKIRYEFGDENYLFRKGNDAYIFLPTGTASRNIDVKVWLDGAIADNEYQNAKIDLSEMTAFAVQYREAAIRAEFTQEELTDDEISAFAIDFSDFE